MVSSVIVGLSGGVDSSLTAALLKDMGYHVTGVSMSIYNQAIPHLKLAGNACYGAQEKQEITDIHLLGEKLGIKTYVFDCSKEYNRQILTYFKTEYLKGNTPNPCIMCNALMKFDLLKQKAYEAGITFDYFSTGHYAQIEKQSNRFLLKKGVDEKKDQSYFLYRLQQQQLATTLFPLGVLTKTQTRQLAHEKGLDSYDKPDSQDFYSGDYNDLLQMPPKEGLIMLLDGTPLGKHYGFWNYTIGQRKGLRIAYPQPLFVAEIDAQHNIVYVGTAEQLQQTTVFVTNLSWIAFDETPSHPFRAFAKQRSTAPPSPATITPIKNGVKVEYDTIQKSFTPGQSVVFYQDDIVLGGGFISA